MGKETEFVLGEKEYILIGVRVEIAGTKIVKDGTLGKTTFTPVQLVNEVCRLKTKRSIRDFISKFGMIDEHETDEIGTYFSFGKMFRDILRLKKELDKEDGDIFNVFDYNEDEREITWKSDDTPVRLRGWKSKEIEMHLTTIEGKNEFVLIQGGGKYLIEPRMIPAIISSLMRQDCKAICDYSAINFIGEGKNRRYAPIERRIIAHLGNLMLYSLAEVIDDHARIGICEKCGDPTIIQREREHIYCGGACKKSAERGK